MGAHLADQQLLRQPAHMVPVLVLRHLPRCLFHREGARAALGGGALPLGGLRAFPQRQSTVDGRQQRLHGHLFLLPRNAVEARDEPLLAGHDALGFRRHDSVVHHSEHSFSRRIHDVDQHLQRQLCHNHAEHDAGHLRPSRPVDEPEPASSARHLLHRRAQHGLFHLALPYALLL